MKQMPRSTYDYCIVLKTSARLIVFGDATHSDEKTTSLPCQSSFHENTLTPTRFVSSLTPIAFWDWN